MPPLPGRPRAARLLLLPALLTAALCVLPCARVGAQLSNLNPQQPVVAPNVAAVTAVNQALRKGDTEGALKAAEDGVRNFPHDVQLRFLRAVVLEDLDRVDAATAEFESLSSEFPELPEPYNNLAVIRAGQGRYADAEHLLQQAIAVQANYVTARVNLGDLYVSMAIAAYEQAGGLDPSNAVIKRKLALAREVGSKLRSARN